MTNEELDAIAELVEDHSTRQQHELRATYTALVDASVAGHVWAICALIGQENYPAFLANELARVQGVEVQAGELDGGV